MRIISSLVMLSITICVTSTVAEDMAMKDDSRARMRDNETAELGEIARNAAEVYRTLVTQKTIPESVINRSECISVIPNVITAAAVVGGSHGDGIVHCRLNDGRWSPAAFYDLTRGSLGVQLGAKATDMVLFFTNRDAVAALKEGKVDFGADASVVAGSFDQTFDVSKAGVVAYQKSAGAFMGAAVDGGTLSHDDDANRAYYGQDVKSTAILEGTTAVKAKDTSLITLLPK